MTFKPSEEDLAYDRPQEPKGPFLYKSEDVEIKREKDDITLAGTLTYPDGDGPFPAVVLISGSGPQNRNSEIFGHKSFCSLLTISQIGVTQSCAMTIEV